METHVITSEAHRGLPGGSALLKLQSDERLIKLIRRDNISAFEVLFQRYQSRLLAFCRHMLRSNEDAEDVLQEVFAAAYNAMRADSREIQVRPWLYRIARNRCLNHLRRPVATADEEIEGHVDGAGTAAERVELKVKFQHLVADVGELPESQRTALLLREMDDLSYDQIAEAMETTIPSVKSLLVRARVSLAEAAEAREISCDEVRLDLGEVAEGLKKISPPVRRHLRQCDRCKAFKAQLGDSSKSLHAVYAFGLFAFVKKAVAAKFLFFGGGSSAGGSVAAGTAGSGAIGGAAAAGGGAALSGAAAGGSAIGGALGAKVAAVAATATLATAGAVGVKNEISSAPVKPKHQIALTKSQQADKAPVKVDVAKTESTTAPPPAVVTPPPAPAEPPAPVTEAPPAPEPTPEATKPAEKTKEPEKVAEENGTAMLNPDKEATTPDSGVPVPETQPTETPPAETTTPTDGTTTPPDSTQPPSSDPNTPAPTP